MSLAEDATEREQVHPPLLSESIRSNPRQRLKSALWYSIGQYVDDSLLSDSLNATPQFIGALTELVYTQIGTYPLIHTSAFLHPLKDHSADAHPLQQTQHRTWKPSRRMRAGAR
jgi:hypothetical protein